MSQPEEVYGDSTDEELVVDRSKHDRAAAMGRPIPPRWVTVSCVGIQIANRSEAIAHFFYLFCHAFIHSVFCSLFPYVCINVTHICLFLSLYIYICVGGWVGLREIVDILPSWKKEFLVLIFLHSINHRNFPCSGVKMCLPLFPRKSVWLCGVFLARYVVQWPLFLLLANFTCVWRTRILKSLFFFTCCSRLTLMVEAVSVWMNYMRF